MSMNDPLSAFNAAADAINRGDWRGLADLCDPASLSLFKRQKVAEFSPKLQGPIWTADDIQRHSPDMPREVAEWQAKQMLKHQDRSEWMADQLPDIPNIDALRQADPRDIFATWMRGRSPQYQLEKAIESGAMPAAVREAMQAQPVGIRTMVARGSLMRDENTAYIVCRWVHEDMTPPGEAEPPEDFVPEIPQDEQQIADLTAEWPIIAYMRKQQHGEWRLAVTENFLNLGMMAFAYGWEPVEGAE